MIAWLSVGLAGVVLGLTLVWLYARSEYRRGKLQAEKERERDDLTRLGVMAEHIGRPVVSDPHALAARWLRRLRNNAGDADPPPVSDADDGDGGGGDPGRTR